MNIFFIRKNKFLKSVDEDSIERIYNSDKHNMESQLGRFLVKYVGAKLYALNDVEILVKNKKPYFKNSDIQFSISHSDDFVGVIFSKGDVGLDIEKFKERDLNRISKYFKKNFKNLYEFYQYWTLYEADYKSSVSNEFKTTLRYEDYFVSISSVIDTEGLRIFEVSPLCAEKLIDLSVINESVELSIEEINQDELMFLPLLNI